MSWWRKVLALSGFYCYAQGKHKYAILVLHGDDFPQSEKGVDCPCGRVTDYGWSQG
jgi:hypothetical protein